MRTRAAIIQGAKWVGGFAAASRATAGRLTILAYHGFSAWHAHLFRPRLFLEPGLFARRLEFLRAEGFRVLPLDDAVGRLRAGSLGTKEIAITIDDGFHTTAEIAIPLLRRHGFPATIYSTTYYVRTNQPIFRLVAQYCFWRSAGRVFPLDGLLPGRAGSVIIGTPGAERALWDIIERAEAFGSEDERIEMAREMARRTEVDYDEIVRSRRFTLLSEEQIAKAAAAGTDFQLHTHRHRLPLEREEVLREIADNRAVLEPLVGRRLRHLCYPSNAWSMAQWPALREAGVETGTTCEPGMNSRDAEPLGLRRLLDHSGIPQIVFEGELHGIGEAWRVFARRRRARVGAPPRDAAFLSADARPSASPATEPEAEGMTVGVQ